MLLGARRAGRAARAMASSATPAGASRGVLSASIGGFRARVPSSSSRGVSDPVVAGFDRRARARAWSLDGARAYRGGAAIVRAVPVSDPPADPASEGGGTKTTTTARARSRSRAPSSPESALDVLSDDALGPAHAAARRWIVFSDLHVNRKTAPVAMEVLRRVHDAALARDAGIVFLGDFWHARGAIPVEPLVEALDAIRAWTVPAVMIPGNHDQVTAGGETHALAPLAAANPDFVRVISRPALWRGALWLPYRRDPAALRDAVAEAKRLATLTTGETETETDRHRFDAIMCHADVTGASMNERFQARDGLDPELFRVDHLASGSGSESVAPSIPTYTGHYHKPHTVPGTRITYVGSPYQVSRAESGQTKALVVLDADAGWRGWVGDETPNASGDASPRGGDAAVTDLPREALLTLDLGPRHFSVRGEDASPPAEGRAGDVIRWTLPLSSASGIDAKTKTKTKTGAADGPASVPGIDAARASGMVVEVCYETVASPVRIPEAEELGPAGLYDAYATAAALPDDVVAFGKSVLAEVAASTAESDADGTSRASLDLSRGAATLRLSLASVEVEGFGAFADAVTYPLADRGVCAVVGDNRDDRCSDSNGAGKTTLVMAPMWALTGASDTRIEGGSGKTLTKTDVVNDARASARVRLEGTVDDAPFWVERRVSRAKLLSLRYGVGDEERTLADARLTQAAMDRDLGASTAARVAFHGQHTVGALLDANDATLKAALGELVDADTWAAAKETSKRRVAEARKRVAALGADVNAREEYLARAMARLEAARAASDAWAEATAREEAATKAENQIAEDALADALGRCAAASTELRRAAAEWDATENAAAARAAALERELWEGSAAAAEGADEAKSAAEAATLEAEAESARRRVADAQRDESEKRAVAAQAHAAVGSFQGVAPGGGLRLLAHDHRAVQEETDEEGEEGDDSEAAADEDASSSSSSSSSSASLGQCDRCLQPIDPRYHRDTLRSLIAEAERTRAAHETSGRALRDAERVAADAAARLRRHAEMASAARAAAAAAREAAARRARDANERLAAVRASRVNPHVVAAALARSDAAVASAAVAPRAARETARDLRENADAAALVAAAEDAAAEAERLARDLARRAADAAARRAAAAADPHAREVATLSSQAESESSALDERRAEVRDAEEALAVARRADAAFGTRGIQSYLFEGALAELSARVGTYMEALTGGALTMELRPAAVGAAAAGAGAGASARSSAASMKKRAGDADDADDADDGLSDASSVAKPSAAAAEKIEKVIHAHSHDGSRAPRSLRQLSGGERRRAALALALAHADLAAARGGVACDLLVLDEVLQHLDQEGIARVAALLRGLPRGTVLLTSQADSSTAHLFDVVDRVFKRAGASGVATAEERGEDVEDDEGREGTA